MIRHLCIQSFSFSKIGVRASLSKMRRNPATRTMHVQKRRNRNLRLSEFGINDGLLPQDLLAGNQAVGNHSRQNG
jgi:hypothetical protein